MRRLGALLMILGANLAIGSVAAAFYLASFGCAMGAADGTCGQGAMGLFIDLMSSSDGVVFWVVIIVGLLVFWKGKRMRERA